ncbi:G-type lectin S-receptor-like serine/threonine-protein kinase At4g27290 [Vitis riparia]|uniref:G-type lectin S-receptor-like serine/threonine-protein kinase At4g27290 n=1 Tax=Vitis riparia TaxID=96939 RepID=UPI00155AEF78|nr:G-type lectin S-receptor-like serine/threonine-protein kinase At4g27290 [Vitis riparia]
MPEHLPEHLLAPMPMHLPVLGDTLNAPRIHARTLPCPYALTLAHPPYAHTTPGCAPSHPHNNSGYMSPEYVIVGLYSTKSDVYSFGVSVLEIVSGKRNRGFYHPNLCINLLGHAWTLYMEGRSFEIIDASMGDTYNLSEVLRSINVGLWCVQRCPDDRPSMSSVILMLGSEGVLPQPGKPGFFSERHVLEANSNREATSFSGNEDISKILDA